MPTVPLRLSSQVESYNTKESTTTTVIPSFDPTINPLPNLLQTPTGLALIEIQGKIHLSGLPSSESISPIGKLVFPHYDPNDITNDQTWMKTVHLYVGKHQRLSGEVKKLPKAVGVMRKRVLETGSSDNLFEGREEFEVMEIVEWKILFSSRPEPVGN